MDKPNEYGNALEQEPKRLRLQVRQFVNEFEVYHTIGDC